MGLAFLPASGFNGDSCRARRRWSTAASKKPSQAIRHEGLALAKPEFDRLIKMAASMLASRHICASLNIKPDEEEFRFGFTAEGWIIWHLRKPNQMGVPPSPMWGMKNPCATPPCLCGRLCPGALAARLLKAG